MLTVLSVAYPLAAVRPETAGGAEQVLAQIDRALAGRQWRSVVVACEGSEVAGELISVPVLSGPLGDSSKKAAQRAVLEQMRQLLEKTRVDLIHFHGIDFDSYLPDVNVPLLATLHLPPEWYAPQVFKDPRLHLHCVSESQHRCCPSAARLLAPIPNGVDVEFFRPLGRRRNYVVALGRICPEKGLHHAVDAATAAGVPIIIAGELYRYPAHEEYFRHEIEPRLGRGVRFVGPVGPVRKRRLLAHARCALIPSLAPETSSLVAMEAAACGTPVIAFPSSALGEVIRDGETGSLVRDTNEMSEAIRVIHHISGDRCRKHAEQHFDVRHTTAEYLRTYVEITGKLTAIRAEWLDLYERCPDAPPFLHPDWQSAWWETFGTCPLRLVEFRRGARLDALAVCYEYQSRLVFVGNGISDRLGILASDREAADALVTRLAQHKLDLQEIPAGSPLLRLPHEQCSVSPAVSTASQVPPRLARNLRQQLRYLQAEGDVRFTTVSSPATLDHLVRLHEARWRDKGKGGMLSDSKVVCFHRRAAAALAASGVLRIHTLSLDDAVIGVLYGFARAGIMHYYLSGFDPAWDRFSPGSLLIRYALEYARSAGDAYFDFLRGPEPYKYRWGATDRPQYRICT